METAKDAPADRDSTYSALLRDVILGTVAVIVLSLAVPAWIIRAEYRKMYGGPVTLTPAAEVLRERASATAVMLPHRPDVLELAERLVREEAEKRAAAQREAERRETERREAERRETERREAEMREAERRETEGREAERREAERRASSARPAPAVAPVVETPQLNFRDSEQAP